MKDYPTHFEYILQNYEVFSTAFPWSPASGTEKQKRRTLLFLKLKNIQAVANQESTTTQAVCSSLGSILYKMIQLHRKINKYPSYRETFESVQNQILMKGQFGDGI